MEKKKDKPEFKGKTCHCEKYEFQQLACGNYYMQGTVLNEHFLFYPN